jgi:hypothetical protein
MIPGVAVLRADLSLPLPRPLLLPGIIWKADILSLPLALAFHLAAYGVLCPSALFCRLTFAEGNVVFVPVRMIP